MLVGIYLFHGQILNIQVLENFLFDVGDPEAFGCTDPDAINYDENAD